MSDGKISISCELWVREDHHTPDQEYDPSKLEPIEFENEIVEKTFTYPVPDEWRSTEFTLGKTDQHWYKGPRYLVFQFDKDTGKEVGWCLTTAQELHRPVPLNVVQVKIDALENDQTCFLAELGNDQGHPEHAEHILNREWGILHEAPDGYNHTWYTDEVLPRDIYDEFNLTYNFETNQIDVPIKGWENEGRVDVTWDDVKAIRNKMLHDSDGKISPDAPVEIQEKWLRYRQLLRDMPDALAHYPAWVAGKMWPTAPDHRPPADPSDKSDMAPVV